MSGEFRTIDKIERWTVKGTGARSLAGSARTHMRHGAWFFSLKASKEQAYRDGRCHVWLELEVARLAGFRNHLVFVRGSTVFAYAEAEYLKAAMKHLDILGCYAKMERCHGGIHGRRRRSARS